MDFVTNKQNTTQPCAALSIYIELHKLTQHGKLLITENDEEAQAAAKDAIEQALLLKKAVKAFFANPSKENQDTFWQTHHAAIEKISIHRNYKKLPLTILANIAFVIAT